MVLKELIEKLKGMRNEEEQEIVDDNETRDKYLRSLRREKRTQMEEGEKEKLIKEIAEHKKQRIRKHLFGIKDNAEKKKSLIETIKKKKEVKILEEEHNILSNKVIKKKEGMSFLEKSNL